MNPFLSRLRQAGYLLPLGLSGYLILKGAQGPLLGWPCPLRALTGIPCPTCFLTRATVAALRGNLSESIQLHAFGPLVAVALIAWCFTAISQRRLIPREIPAWPLAVGAVVLFAYWLMRLMFSYGLGFRGAPGFP